MKNVILLLFLLGFYFGAIQAQETPEGYEQLLPRGKIAAITQPQYVPASEAQIADDSWILGVVINGKAIAYSLNLLNSHEVVNDSEGDLHFAAVW